MIIHPNAERIWSIATHYHEYIVRLIVDLECYQPFISPHITHQILKKRANHFSLQLFFFMNLCIWDIFILTIIFIFTRIYGLCHWKSQYKTTISWPIADNIHVYQVCICAYAQMKVNKDICLLITCWKLPS